MIGTRALSDLNYLHAQCNLHICSAPSGDMGQHHRQQSSMYTGQGRGWDSAHRAGASTLEPLELEKCCNPPAHFPPTSGPTFTCGELTPLTLWNGVTQPLHFPGTKGHLFQQQALFSWEYGSEFYFLALNFKKLKPMEKIFILQLVLGIYLL